MVLPLRIGETKTSSCTSPTSLSLSLSLSRLGWIEFFVFKIETKLIEKKKNHIWKLNKISFANHCHCTYVTATHLLKPLAVPEPKGKV